MARYSLLNVYATHSDGTVDGSWIQDHVGTYESAKAKAALIEAANSHRIAVAVVQHISHPTPMLDFWTNRRLATHSAGH